VLFSILQHCRDIWENVLADICYTRGGLFSPSYYNPWLYICIESASVSITAFALFLEIFSVPYCWQHEMSRPLRADCRRGLSKARYRVVERHASILLGCGSRRFAYIDVTAVRIIRAGWAVICATLSSSVDLSSF
jgi:hypothetical protein